MTYEHIGEAPRREGQGSVHVFWSYCETQGPRRSLEQRKALHGTYARVESGHEMERQEVGLARFCACVKYINKI